MWAGGYPLWWPQVHARVPDSAWTPWQIGLPNAGGAGCGWEVAASPGIITMIIMLLLVLLCYYYYYYYYYYY